MYDHEYDEIYEDERTKMTDEQQQFEEDCKERVQDMREELRSIF